MPQSHAQFVKVQHAHRHIYGNAQMLAAAGNANFAAHVKARCLCYKLLQSSVGSARNRARADVGFRNNALALRRNNGRRREAAAELFMSERTLYRKIKELGIEDD